MGRSGLVQDDRARRAHRSGVPNVLDQLVGWVVAQHHDAVIVTLIKDIRSGHDALASTLTRMVFHLFV